MNFTKMHGLGNDYIYIDCINNKLDFDISTICKKLCDRHFGIGSDGIIIIYNSNIADFKMLMYNSDGSSSQMCGNGIRCVGKYLYDNKYIKKETIRIETLAGIKTLYLKVQNNIIESITVDMGEPILESNLIPVLSKELITKNLELEIIDRKFYFTCVSMGNPHAVTIIDDIDNFDINKYGSLIEKNSVFPEKSNVEFIEIIDKNTIKMRVWERGTGETLACGTGACASVIACVINNLTTRDVKVNLLGGNLDILFNETNNHVYMTGTANHCFNGKFNISDYV